MATKLTESEYPLWLKALCLLLSVICFIGTAACAFYILIVERFIPNIDLYSDAPVSFYESELYTDLLYRDMVRISDVLYAPQAKKQLETFTAQRNAVIEREVNRYLSQKAAIIRAEVYYVATHYTQMDDDYYFDAYMRDFHETSTTVPAAAKPEDSTAFAKAEETTPQTTLENSQTITKPVTAAPESTTAQTTGAVNLSAFTDVAVDDRAPYNVRYCQSLCRTVSGLDWLKYESLVREDAFSEQTFESDFGDLGNNRFYEFRYTGDQIRASLESDYDEQLKETAQNISDDSDRAYLEQLVNLKYLAIDPQGTVSTNMTPDERNGKKILSHERYFLYKNGAVTCKPDKTQSEKSFRIERCILDNLNNPVLHDATLYMYLEDTLQPGDDYYTGKALVDRLFVQHSPKTVLLAGLASGIGTLLFFVTLLYFCGHMAGTDGITLAPIDRIPTDVHLLCFAAAEIMLAVFGVLLLDSLDNGILSMNGYYASDLPLHGNTGVMETVLKPALVLGIVAVMYLLAAEWLTSTVRIKKARLSFFRRFVLWKLVRIAWHGIVFCARKIAAAFRFLFDKPKKLRRLPFVLSALYMAAVVLCALLAWAADAPLPALIGIPVVTVLFILVAVRFLRMLDEVIDASAAHRPVREKTTRHMPRALRELSENLTLTHRELDRAVAEAVRNERTKAELITNVSHDLKTPLTSVISYVDLLKKCDIQDEKAVEYLGVLDEKSAKLKRLVEDLIEASKVNTGNVTLQRIPLNLAELAMQAVVESAPDFEKNTLELKYTPPEAPPILFADGTKTYRILDNLLSNARKYSAPHTRVYVKVDEDESFGVFEIKNTSREALDIAPDELMERFVRGDRSRTQDGNGLGLSIAQQLCLLQGGKLNVSIDGDLFKATVYLPKYSKSEGIADT